MKDIYDRTAGGKIARAKTSVLPEQKVAKRNLQKALREIRDAGLDPARKSFAADGRAKH